MSGPGASSAAATIDVLGLAAGLACLVPQWIWVAWLARSALPWRRDAESSRRRWVALAFGLASIVIGVLAIPLLHRGLGVSPGEAHFKVVSEVWNAHEVAVVLVLGLVARRRNAPSPPPARRNPAPRTIFVVLMAWVALSGVVVALRFGPLAGHPGAEHTSRFLFLAVAVIATLVVLLVVALRAKRGDGPTDGPRIGTGDA